MNYFFLEVIPDRQLPINLWHHYNSFIMLFEKLYYPKAFYFEDIPSLLIRTTDSPDHVVDNIIDMKTNHWNANEIPLVYYKLFIRERFVFVQNPIKEIEQELSGEQLYELCAKWHFEESGIDFLKDEIAIEKENDKYIQGDLWD